jgi:hypothetical protein
LSDVIFVALITLFFVAAALLVRAYGHIAAGPVESVARMTGNEDEPGPVT